MKDLDKIKEAQAREDRRAESIARGEAQLMIGRGPADRALLLAAMPDMIREIDERGVALGEAARLLKEADAEIVTLRAEIERIEKERALWESRFQTAAANARLRDAEIAALAAWKEHTRTAIASAEKCIREGRAERALAELGRVSS